MRWSVNEIVCDGAACIEKPVVVERVALFEGDFTFSDAENMGACADWSYIYHFECAFEAMETLNAKDGFEVTQTDQQIAAVHGMQGVGHFLIDRQGRIVVPASLRDLLGLANDAVIVGARDHAEIWEPAAWDDYRKAMEAPDALAAHLTGLGI